MNSNFAVIFLCLILGGVLRITKRFPLATPQVLNSFIIWVSLPALILIQIPILFQTTALTFELLIPISMAWIQIFLSLGFFYSIGKHFKWKHTEVGALVLTAGLGNTSFVGFPILQSLYGEEAIRIGVLVDQPGSFLVLSTVGIIIASIYSPGAGKKIEAKTIIKKVVTFPPFVALLVACLWYLTGTKAQSSVQPIFEKLAATLVPLALIAVGFQLKLSQKVIYKYWKALAFGLSFKLFLVPAFFFVFYTVILDSNGFITKITILESAMASMITSAVVAEDFGLNAEIANLMVGVGIPLSLVTVSLWNHWL
jgi:predicted permease